MKTVITIENSRITVQVDDEQPISVGAPLPAPILAPSRTAQKVGAVLDQKHCSVCKEQFEVEGRRRVCDQCRRKQKRQAQQRWYDKRRRVTAKPSKKESEVLFCRFCSAWTTHDSEHHPNPPKQAEEPQFLPGHEKTPEEIASWKPVVSGVTPSVPNVATKTDAAGGFADPWNCDSCRRRSKLCPFHQGMADEGKQPPSHKVKRKV